DPALAAQLIGRPREDTVLDHLTPREREVLALMAEGFTDRGIAERLYVTPNTVETHIRHIIGKLGLPAAPSDNRRVHAVLAYLRPAWASRSRPPSAGASVRCAAPVPTTTERSRSTSWARANASGRPGSGGRHQQVGGPAAWGHSAPSTGPDTAAASRETA